MITSLHATDIPQIVKIHKNELHGFLSDLGEGFLIKFYEVSLHIPEMFTLVEKENEQILGFVTGAIRVKGLYKKMIFKNPFMFGILFLGYFITHPLQLVKLCQLVSYPGFKDDIPELLTIAVKKDYQSRGIGTKLFKEVIKEFKKKGFKKFRVSVYDKLSANEFYKKMGCRFEKSFEFLGEKMNYYLHFV